MSLTAAPVMLPALAPHHRQDAARAWLNQVEFGDYVIVTTLDGTAVTGTVSEASKSVVWLYDHDDVEETHHDDEWHAPAEHIESAGHVVPPDRWDMAWTRWPWNRMRHLRSHRGRTATRDLRKQLRSVLC